MVRVLARHIYLRLLSVTCLPPSPRREEGEAIRRAPRGGRGGGGGVMWVCVPCVSTHAVRMSVSFHHVSTVRPFRPMTAASMTGPQDASVVPGRSVAA